MNGLMEDCFKFVGAFLDEVDLADVETQETLSLDEIDPPKNDCDERGVIGVVQVQLELGFEVEADCSSEISVSVIVVPEKWLVKVGITNWGNDLSANSSFS